MTMIDAQEIRADRYAEIGAVVQRDVAVIVDRWVQRATADQPPGKRIHHAVLLDHLPHLLSELGRDLQEASEGGTPHHGRSAARHAEQRW